MRVRCLIVSGVTVDRDTWIIGVIVILYVYIELKFVYDKQNAGKLVWNKWR
jgi:hypothetical protein